MKNRSKILFFLICILGLGLRTKLWMDSGGIYTRGGNPDIDNYLNMASWILDQNWAKLTQYRVGQIAYPIFLFPIHLFGIGPGIYVFVLHSSMVLLTLFFTFQAGKQLLNEGYGLLLSLCVAVNVMMYKWFTWMWTETMYYLVLAFFVYRTLLWWSLLHSKKNQFFWGLASCFLLFTKPEGFPAVVGGLGFGLFLILRRRLSLVKSLLAVTATGSFGLTLFLLSMFSVPGFEKKVLSHIHVGHGLWLTMRTVANPAGWEQDQAYADLGTINGPFGSLSPSEKYYQMSLNGLGLIKENPLKFCKNVLIRSTAILFPGIYWFQWSPARRAIDIIFSFLLVICSIISVVRYKNNELIVGVHIVALSMLSFVSLYLADGDVRFRTPIYFVMGVGGLGVLYNGIRSLLLATWNLVGHWSSKTSNIRRQIPYSAT